MIDVVIPTIGRASLAVLLESLARASGPQPERIFIVDDRRDTSRPLAFGKLDAAFLAHIMVLEGRAAGPAAARNVGWRASQARFIAFLDDDVVVSDDWLDALEHDLRDLPVDVAGSTGCVEVPLPTHRAPTDAERNVASLATARWITADCAYLRRDLAAVGGFDERFTRAFREDADLALRIVGRGRRIVAGERRIVHPVKAENWRSSIDAQAGNADDVLMQALHGRDWYERAGASRGAFAQHVLTVGCASVSAIASLARNRSLAALAGGCASALLGRFAWQRIAPGPRSGAEIARMLVTSLVIPFAAVIERGRGYLRLRSQLRDRARAPLAVASAVLFDRDGTLIADVPFNRDPDCVEAMPHARSALDRLRVAGIATAVVTNQSGIALGHLRASDVDAINARTQELLGPLGPIFSCPHGKDDGCGCRKPAPQLIEDAARALGIRPSDCVVIGDIGADVEAARAAGARAILVPNAVTRREEIVAAPHVADDLDRAVTAVLSGVA